MATRSIAFFIFFLPLLLVSEDLESQARRIERGDEAFEQRHYYEAVEYYRRAYSRISRRDRDEAARIAYNSAICYSKINDSRRAEMWFRRSMRLGYDDPELIVRFADVLMKNEKYDEAVEQYKIFSEKKPDDPRGETGIKSVELTQELLENPSIYSVEVQRQFNSRYDDFAPTYGDHRESSLIFTSARDESMNSKDDPWTGQYHTNLFISYQDRAEDWGSPVLLDEGPVNTEFNEGTPSLNPGKTLLYFTRCVTEEGKDLGCRIFKSRREGAKWGSPQKIELVNDSSISIGHPAISPDELKLYFVSDMPGGVGEKDIWVARRNNVNEDFGRPVNLGQVINTHGNEMFPYVREDGVLFFASDGHPGMGGLDIFYSEKVGDEWTEPVNMGYPINSNRDDFGIIFKSNQRKGYFSSNRGVRRGDEIYSFFLAPLEFSLKGTVRDDSTKWVLPGATVQLIGSDGTIEVEETDRDGKYYFDKRQMKPDQTYDILASYDGYLSQRGRESTVDLERSREFVYDFYLEPISDVPIALPEILYDFDSWELKPQFQDSLAGLVETLMNNPNIVIELASHADSRGTHEHNDLLTQRRAQAVVDFIIERGVDPQRLEAKGYGKRQPRKIMETIERDGFVFEAETVLTEEYIEDLPEEEHREAAHQLNRRTEFMVLRDDFDPEIEGDQTGEEDVPVRIDLKQDD